ncbi:DUF2490 domain-containing protein [Flammeovirga yaeyamensis]|uniref:DUF2490 domain-containing protein n=1 Tax=Flammeovirga yaeyamensis TaxID=367791 RepID=A0AAX1NAH0_9BACT|nr:DUF2490 domain-containing protein [Flammeovirga yaeyamensis]MBB3700080.1 hypothetical protein [Flammeovirga yaeyamensis]NMF37486.1 DUF2490 domain-containing protein [Flammeovirga yaeyamensis]QWG04543.1 DUF2490 domain-containing protein [Flammeovirga yaeyamensis]
MKLTKSVLLTLSILFCSVVSKAQELPDVGSWYIYNGFYKFSPKFEIFVESQVRTYDVVSDVQSFFVRPFFCYNVKDNFQLAISQEYHHNSPYEPVNPDGQTSSEYRTTLQAITSQKLGRFTLQHRYRYELRSLESGLAQRGRYRAQVGVPISDKTMHQGVFFSTFGNEILIDIDPNTQFSQNRAYAMLGYQMTKSLNFQAGYMYLSRNGTPNEHRLQIFLTHKLAFFD